MAPKKAPSTPAAPRNRSKKAAASVVAVPSATVAETVAESVVESATTGFTQGPVPVEGPRVVLHLPRACDDLVSDATLAPPIPFGDDVLGLMVAAAPPTATPDGPAVMTGFEAAWPRSTQHACWWCCHPFDGAPVGLPLRLSCGVFHCTGVFCSLECAWTFNRRERRGFDADESANNLQLMAQRMGRLKPLRVAPERCLLRMFGGTLSIEAFRVHHQDDVLCLHTPPIYSVVPAVEEISTANGATRRPDQRIPLDKARLRRAEAERQNTRLGASRSDALRRGTLEATMPNLKVSASASGSGSALEF